MNQTYILCLLFAFLSITLCHSQNSIAYEYDQAGNRTLRKVVVLQAKAKKHHATTDSTAVVEKINNLEVAIYPNPTRGLIVVDLTSFPENDEITVELYSGRGVLISRITSPPEMINLDLTAHPRAWYVLRINTSKFKREYKIIKE